MVRGLQENRQKNQIRTRELDEHSNQHKEKTTLGSEKKQRNILTCGVATSSIIKAEPSNGRRYRTPVLTITATKYALLETKRKLPQTGRSVR